MSKELEALRMLEQVCLVANVADMSGEIKVVENALKDYENLQLKHRSMTEQVFNDFKKLKAFEIIKNKSVDIKYFRLCKYCHDYNFALDVEELTDEEFEILKEAL